MIASDKDQGIKQMIDLCWYNPLLMARMRGNSGRVLLFDIGASGALGKFEVLLDCLKHFGFQLNDVNNKPYVNYYLSEASPPTRGRNLNDFCGLDTFNLKPDSHKASLIYAICNILNGVDDNFWQQFFQYNDHCDDQYLKFLEIVIYTCHNNRYVKNKVAESSNWASFISRIICCRKLSIKFLYFILTTFGGLEIKANDIKNVYEYHNGDEMIDTIVKIMKDRVPGK